MTTYTFADLDKWVTKTEKRMNAVFKESAQRVALEVKSRTRVDTGFLRSSLLASTSSMPVIDRDARPVAGNVYANRNEQIALVIAGASLGQTIYLGFVASYAGIREYHDGMVKMTAQRWPMIVREVVAEAKARYP